MAGAPWIGPDLRADIRERTIAMTNQENTATVTSDDEAQFEQAMKIVEARCKRAGEEMAATLGAAMAEAVNALQPVLQPIVGASPIFEDFYNPLQKLEFFLPHLKKACARAQALQRLDANNMLHGHINAHAWREEDLRDLRRIMLGESTTSAA
jgi:hypothetical protein